MAKKPESRLQRRIREALEKKFSGAKCFKIHGGPFQEAGIPDLICCINGRFFGFEVKLDNKRSKLSAIQEEVIWELLEAGGTACAVTSPDEALAIVEEAERLSATGRQIRVSTKRCRVVLPPEVRENLDCHGDNRTGRTRRLPNRRSSNK